MPVMACADAGAWAMTGFVGMDREVVGGNALVVNPDTVGTTFSIAMRHPDVSGRCAAWPLARSAKGTDSNNANMAGAM